MRIKIGFVGAQGTGKTTAAYDLAAKLKKAGHDVYVLSEVARSCPLPINEDATFEAQLWIMGKQLTREQSAKGNILISDRTLLDSFCYSLRANKDFFKNMFPFIKEYMKTYDAIFLLKPNDDYLIDDGTRSTNKDFRDEIDEIMMKCIDTLEIPVIDVEDKFEYIENILGDMNVKC